MVFRSKMDAPFIGSISLAILLIGAASIVPLFLEDVQFSEMLILMAIFFVTTGFILWTIFDIQYVFHEDHLFVKGGPFRSRIPYRSILKISICPNQRSFSSTFNCGHRSFSSETKASWSLGEIFTVPNMVALLVSSSASRADNKR